MAHTTCPFLFQILKKFSFFRFLKIYLSTRSVLNPFSYLAYTDKMLIGHFTHVSSNFRNYNINLQLDKVGEPKKEKLKN